MSRSKPVERQAAIFAIDGLRVRLLQGHKAPNDVKVQVATPGGDWVTVSYKAVCALIEILGDNEDRIYPEPLEGGDMLLRAVSAAMDYGTDSDEFESIMRKRLPFVLIV